MITISNNRSINFKHANLVVCKNHELGKFVVYESLFMVNCEHPDFVVGQPGAEFLKTVPTVWDDIKVLSGYPGEHIAMMKRSGDRYFIGTMNNSESRTIQLKLDFLPKGKYEMTRWTDAKNADEKPKNFVKAIKLASRNEVLKIKMAIGGGFVAELIPVK